MPVKPDDSPCRVRVSADSDSEDSDDGGRGLNVFQTFDPFGDSASRAAESKSSGPPAGVTFDVFSDEPASVNAAGVSATAPATQAPLERKIIDGPPPGIPAPAPGPAGIWPTHPMAYMPGFMPMYYGTHPPGVQAVAANREEVDALLLEKAALEAENAALRAHMALEADRAGAMAAVGMHAAGMAAMQAPAQQVPTKALKNKKKGVEAVGGSTGGKPAAEDKSAVKATSESAPAVEIVPDETFHTLMLRSLPSAHGFSRDVLMELLDNEGFKTKYNFVYTPIDFHTERLMGFAFVNFINHEEALRAKVQLDGFSSWGVQSKKVCEVRWGDPSMQGLQANIEHYRSSPVMHESVPHKNRPVILSDGVIQDFPPPTKKIRAPRLRHSGARK